MALTDYLSPFLSFRLYVLATSGYVSVVKVLVLNRWSHTSHNENIIYVDFVFKIFLCTILEMVYKSAYCIGCI